MNSDCKRPFSSLSPPSSPQYRTKSIVRNEPGPPKPTLDLADDREQLLIMAKESIPSPSREDVVEPDACYTILNKPLGTTRHVRIITIGAGASGINMTRTLQQSLTNFEHVVYEKNREVGGTWLENRYPGCRCDIPSHNYQFSWRKKQDWTNFCADANEIEQYLMECRDEVCKKDEIKLHHQVTGMTWMEDEGKWKVKVMNLEQEEEFEDYADFVINASGILNNWKWPEVTGLRDFEGRLIHSANWPEDLNYQDKVVAVIGNGSSGLQIVPAIMPDVKHLVHFIRSPTWIVPPRIPTMMLGPCREILSQIELDEKENFTPTQIEKFQKDPEFYKKFTKITEKEVNSNFPIFIKDSPIQKFAAEKVREFMRTMLGSDESLCQALIPNYELGCRRMTPAPGYLESLRQPKVTLITDEIERFVPEGIQLRNGKIIKLDIIVCATGFETSFIPRFPIVGKDGINLQNRWHKEVPKAYMSCAMSGMPNYFTILGPNAPIAHGSVFTLSEHISKYLTGIIRKCQTENIKSIVPSEEAIADYFEHVTHFMPRTTWSGGCRSWFKNASKTGPVTAVHPGSRIHFFQMLENFRGEDWEYTYDKEARGNRFAYLGNGFSSIELDPSSDSTWYLYDE